MEEEAKKLSIGRAVAKEVIFYAGGRYTIIKYLDDWEKHCKQITASGKKQKKR